MAPQIYTVPDGESNSSQLMSVILLMPVRLLMQLRQAGFVFGLV